MDLQLFLAHADDHAPALAHGLPGSAMAEALPLEERAEDRQAARSQTRGARALPPDDLSEQGWGVIAPKGAEGDRLLRLIEPLQQRRAAQQGAEVIVYRVDPAMDEIEAGRWMQQDYWDAVERREDVLPRFLLVLGDADAVSWDLQQVLANDAFVGRLAFDDDHGYEAYVDKALRWEREPPASGASALFFTAQDGSPAVIEGHHHLMQPSLTIVETLAAQGKLSMRELLEVPYRLHAPPASTSPAGASGYAETMLRAAANARAGMLFSVSHGAGAPRAGWTTHAEQRAVQGAMILSRHERLTAADLTSRPFLPGGVWFYFACFGAGTPSESAYHPWLDRLHQLGLIRPANEVLTSLPKRGEPPFVAALPKAVLANPEGPLGLIGHVDLAWTWSFRDAGLSRGRAGSGARAERFQGMLRALLGGHRLGVAHQALVSFARSAGYELPAMYERGPRREISLEMSASEEAWEARRADLWLQRHDLGAYVLLGDPAARLPIAHLPAGISRVT